MKVNIWANSKVILLAIVTAFISYQDGYSTDLIEPVFPKDCQQGVTRVPLIHLRSEFPFDTNLISSQSPTYPITDSTKGQGNFILLKKFFYDNLPDSLYSVVSERCNVLFEDEYNIKLAANRFLSYDTEYTLIINDNLKVLKPNEGNPSIIDTVSDAKTYTCLFRTQLPPLQIISNSVEDKEILGCDDSLKLIFNRKIDLTEWQLDNAFSLYKVGDVIDLGDNEIGYEIDTLSCDYQISSDSLSINIIPSEINAEERYIFKASFNVINGDENLPDYTQSYHLPNETTLKINSKPFFPMDTLPDDMKPENGLQEYYVRPDDTIYVVMPLIKEDFFFTGWENLTEGMHPSANILKIVGSCGEMEKKEVTAKYARIPKDTLSLAAMVGMDNSPHSCSKYRVDGYSDSLNPNTYLYKRFSNTPLVISANICNGFTFNNWESEEEEYDDETMPIISMTRDIYEDWMDDHGTGPGRKGFGGRVRFEPISCTQSTFKVKASFVVADDHGGEFDGDNIITSVFSTLKINGHNITLAGTNKVAEGGRTETTFPFTGATFEADLNDCYEIMSIYVETDGHMSGNLYNKSLKEFPGMNEVDYDPFPYNLYDITTNSRACTKYIYIVVRRSTVEYEYAMTEKDGDRIPSIRDAYIELTPTPPTFLNKQLWPSGAYPPGGDQTYNRVIYSDENSDGVIDKAVVKHRFKCNQELYAQPIVKAKTGFKMFEWLDGGELSEFEVVDEEIQKIKYTYTTMNEKKTGNHAQSNEFTLNFISIQSDVASEVSPFEIWHGADGSRKYKLIESDLTFYPLWTTNSNQLLGLRTGFDTEREGAYSEISPNHNQMPSMRFHFSKRPNLQSFIDNVSIYDYNKEDRKKRADGHSFKRYDLRYSITPNAKDNIRLINGDPGEGGVNSVIEIDLKTANANTEDKIHFMCHLNPFIINITNGGETNNSILSYLGEIPLVNIDNEMISFLQTSTPGIMITKPSFETFVNLDGGEISDVDLYLYSYSYSNTSVAAIVNETLGGGTEMYTKDDKGNIKAKVSAIKFPTADYQNGPRINDSRNIFTIDKLDQTHAIALNSLFVQHQDAGAFHLVETIVSALSTAYLISTGFIKDSKDVAGMTDIVKKIMADGLNSADDDDDQIIGVTNLFLHKTLTNLSSTGNSTLSLRAFVGEGIWTSMGAEDADAYYYMANEAFDYNDPYRWKNWGTGYYGLYKNKRREAWDSEVIIQKNDNNVIIYVNRILEASLQIVLLQSY